MKYSCSRNEGLFLWDEIAEGKFSFVEKPEFSDCIKRIEILHHKKGRLNNRPHVFKFVIPAKE